MSKDGDLELCTDTSFVISPVAQTPRARVRPSARALGRAQQGSGVPED